MYTFRGNIGRLYMRICGLMPLKSKVVFSSYEGNAYSDNPKAIYEEMKKKAVDYEYIWLMKDKTQVIPGAKIVNVNSLSAIFHLATAKIWIDNCRKREWMIKRKGQYYVQTWHGGLALKKVEADAEDKLAEKYIQSAKNDSRMANLLISGCKFCTEQYQKAFWYSGKILEYGQPRSDIFYRESMEIANKVKNFYKVANKEKLLLYAPTFRVDGNLECYNIDFMQLKQLLEKKWGGKWKIIIRLHPNIQNKQSAIIYNEHILNGSAYDDINELIVASDMVISDYSSCMFDAMEAGKKVILYASDIERYMKDRGTYLSFEELPFLLSSNNIELQEIIENFEESVYQKKVAKFMERCGYFNCSNSSEKIVDYILKEIEE